MYLFLIVLISVLSVLLCVAILVQSGKGGGLAASFGGASSSTDSFIGGRQTATALTKASWIGGGLFLFLALVLAVLSARPTAVPESILRSGLPGQPSPLTEAPPSLLQTEVPSGEAPAADGTDAGVEGGESGGGAEGPPPDGS